MRIWTSTLLGIALLASLCAPTGAFARQNGGERTVTINFTSSASNVLNALARVAHANIVIPQDIKEIVTVRLENAPISQAIEQVAAQAGLVYRKVNGNTYIVTKPALMKEEMRSLGKTETIPVLNTDAEADAALVEKKLPYITAIAVGKNVRLIGAPSDINDARSIITAIDVPAPLVPVQVATYSLRFLKAEEVAAQLTKAYPHLIVQAAGSTRLIISGPKSSVEDAVKTVIEIDNGENAHTHYAIYRVKNVSAMTLQRTLLQTTRDLIVVVGPDPFRPAINQINLATVQQLGQATNGSNGQVAGTGGGGGSLGGGAPQVSVPGAAARTLLLGGSEAAVKAGLEILEKIDLASPQIALDVKVVSANPETVSSLGVTWSQNIGTTVFERPNQAPPNDFPVQLGQSASVKAGDFGLGSFGRLPITFTTQLNAFFTRTDVRVLAKPSITALDDQDGVIFVGETRRIEVQQSGVLGAVSETIVEIPVGVILQMHPRVTEGDQIILRVHPIYSSIEGTAAAGALFNTFSREADTIVRVKSGETVVIGGLLQEEDTKTFNKVPILGDLPLIGTLFRNNARDHLRREVLIFVTPHLLSD